MCIRDSYDYYLFKRAEREAAEKGVAAPRAAASGRVRKMGDATTATSTVVRKDAAPHAAAGVAEHGGRKPRRVHAADGAVAASPAPEAAPAPSGRKTKEQKRAEAEARNRAYRAGRGDKNRLSEVETELAQLQERQEALIELMAQPELYANQSAFDATLAEYNDVKGRIPVLETEWVSLTDELERVGRELQ